MPSSVTTPLTCCPSLGALKITCPGVQPSPTGCSLGVGLGVVSVSSTAGCKTGRVIVGVANRSSVGEGSGMAPGTDGDTK